LAAALRFGVDLATFAMFKKFAQWIDFELLGAGSSDLEATATGFFLYGTRVNQLHAYLIENMRTL
jgi:hypothetical protein